MYDLEKFLAKLREFEFVTDDDGFTELVCKSCLDHVNQIEDGDDLHSIVCMAEIHICHNKQHPPVVRYLSDYRKSTPEGESNNEH